MNLKKKLIVYNRKIRQLCPLRFCFLWNKHKYFRTLGKYEQIKATKENRTAIMCTQHINKATEQFYWISLKMNLLLLLLLLSVSLFLSLCIHYNKSNRFWVRYSPDFLTTFLDLFILFYLQLKFLVVIVLHNLNTYLYLIYIKCLSAMHLNPIYM